jgi:hypothetical protein
MSMVQPSLLRVSRQFQLITSLDHFSSALRKIWTQNRAATNALMVGIEV